MQHHAFDGPAALAYADGPPRKVPGFASLHRMVTMLVAERMPSHGRMLVLGAGGGMELSAFAEAQPDWSFDGIDPSADMLRVAGRALAQHAARVRLIEGYIGNAPAGPYDAATSLLTFHFIPRDQRLATLQQIYRRLKPGTRTRRRGSDAARGRVCRDRTVLRRAELSGLGGLPRVAADRASDGLLPNAPPGHAAGSHNHQPA